MKLTVHDSGVALRTRGAALCDSCHLPCSTYPPCTSLSPPLFDVPPLPCSLVRGASAIRPLSRLPQRASRPPGRDTHAHTRPPGRGGRQRRWGLCCSTRLARDARVGCPSHGPRAPSHVCGGSALARAIRTVWRVLGTGTVWRVRVLGDGCRDLCARLWP